MRLSPTTRPSPPQSLPATSAHINSQPRAMFAGCACANWGGRWDSNPRRPGSQPGALPAELRPPSSRAPALSMACARPEPFGKPAMILQITRAAPCAHQPGSPREASPARGARSIYEWGGMGISERPEGLGPPITVCFHSGSPQVSPFSLPRRIREAEAWQHRPVRTGFVGVVARGCGRQTVLRAAPGA